MDTNPFKIIEPREQLPEQMKKDVMGSVKSLVLVLRFVQLFMGDYAAVFVDKFKTNTTTKTKDSSK